MYKTLIPLLCIACIGFGCKPSAEEMERRNREVHDEILVDAPTMSYDKEADTIRINSCLISGDLMRRFEYAEVTSCWKGSKGKVQGVTAYFSKIGDSINVAQGGTGVGLLSGTGGDAIVPENMIRILVYEVNICGFWSYGWGPIEVKVQENINYTWQVYRFLYKAYQEVKGNKEK